MFGMKARTRFDRAMVERRAKEGSIRSLGHAAAAIRLTARRSIRRAKTASSPGTPPHTRRGALRSAILYSVEKGQQRALIGPSYEFVGPSALAHEFGGRFRGDAYPRRPFMGPALEKMEPSLPRFWAGSVR